MDIKSLAKSKRAHSQHHNKKHHSKPTTVKAPTLGPGGVSTANKGKEIGEKPHQSQRSKGALPSNRDRYEEDYDSDLDNQSKIGINPATLGFVPKSKGADYKYLLSEAKLQSEANISSESFPSFDDVLSDFTEGFGSLMSARGESILSWTEDDNFIVEDKSTATHEASFLSLNLHLLAEQLEKVDISRRLFIEPDLFLAEQCSEDVRTADEQSDQTQAAYQSQEMKKVSDELIVRRRNKDNLKDEEAEVDLLLNSFTNTKSFNSSDPKQNDTLSAQQEETVFKMESISVSNKAPVLHSQKDSDLFKSNAVAFNFDDDLDDLLKETSPSLLRGILSVQSNRAEPGAKGPDFSEPALRMNNFDDNIDDLLVDTSSSEKNSQGISSGHSGSAQSLKTDQDLSKPATVVPNFDDELDDLLKETLTKKGMSQSHKVSSSQPSHVSSTSFVPVSKSKLSDDFDTFFDSF